MIYYSPFLYYYSNKQRNIPIVIKKGLITIIIIVSSVSTILSKDEHSFIVINNTNELNLVGKQVNYLEDKSGNLTIDDILKPENQSRFIKQDLDVFTKAPSKSAHWFKFTVQNNTTEDIWFEAGGSYSAWIIDFYKPDSAGNYIHPIKTGALRPAKDKEYPSRFYWFKLANANDKSIKTFYLRIESGVSAELPFYIGTFKALDRQQHLMLLITYIFIGAMTIMFLYNFFLFIATRDRLYLSYVFLVFMNTLCYTFNNNFSFFGDNFWWWHKHIVWQFVGDISTTVFIIHFLNLKKNLPIAFNIYRVLISIVFIMALLNLFGVETVVLIDKCMPVTMLLILNTVLVAIYLVIKKQQNAQIFMISWSFMLASLVTFILVINGFLPYNIFTRYIVYIGILTEVLLFSMALANRLNYMRNEKEAVLQENIKLVQNHNIILEKQVKKRTKDLALKNEQLSNVLKDISKQKGQIDDQNKKLRELFDFKEEMTNMIVHDLKNPLNTIINLAENELVLQSGKNMLNLVQNILDVYKYTDTKIPLDKKNYFLYHVTNSSINEVIYLAKQKSISVTNLISEKEKVCIDFDIINRVFINILNNAIKFTPDHGHIYLSAEYSGSNSIKVSIKDNGIGIPQDKIHLVFKKYGQVEKRKSGNTHPSGIGLTYCKTAIEMHGRQIGVISQEGVGSTFWFTIPLAENEKDIHTPDIKIIESELNVSNAEKIRIKDLIYALKQFEFFEVGEIIKTINEFDNEKYPSTNLFIKDIKQVVYSGNFSEYEKLLNIND